MTSSALMSIGMRAMFANYASMQTTGHNIANAQTPGYSRQTVDLATSGGQQTGAGFFGKGVDVVTVQRASDAFLNTQSQVASSMSAMDESRSHVTSPRCVRAKGRGPSTRRSTPSS